MIEIRNKIVKLINEGNLEEIIALFPKTETHIYNFFTEEKLRKLIDLGFPHDNVVDVFVSIGLLCRINAISLDSTGYLIKRGGSVNLTLLDTPLNE